MQNSGIIEIDVHGLTKVQAKKYIEACLAKASKNVYRIRVIHGFHGGTQLKDMVKKTFGNEKHPKVMRIEYGLNAGETDLVLKEL